jgi:hypothetical protein
VQAPSRAPHLGLVLTPGRVFAVPRPLTCRVITAPLSLSPQATTTNECLCLGAWPGVHPDSQTSCAEPRPARREGAANRAGSWSPLPGRTS